MRRCFLLGTKSEVSPIKSRGDILSEGGNPIRTPVRSRWHLTNNSPLSRSAAAAGASEPRHANNNTLALSYSLIARYVSCASEESYASIRAHDEGISQHTP